VKTRAEKCECKYLRSREVYEGITRVSYECSTSSENRPHVHTEWWRKREGG